MILDTIGIHLALVVITSQYPLIGTFTYNAPLQDASLEVSSDLHNWYNIPDNEITILPNGDWAIDLKIKHYTYNGPVENGKAFYRIVGQTQ